MNPARGDQKLPSEQSQRDKSSAVCKTATHYFWFPVLSNANAPSCKALTEKRSALPTQPILRNARYGSSGVRERTNARGYIMCSNKLLATDEEGESKRRWTRVGEPGKGKTGVAHGGPNIDERERDANEATDVWKRGSAYLAASTLAMWRRRSMTRLE